MDYPISVPGVGLVGGKFTDGDPLLSQQASLDPAAWANAVTDELLNVIIAAGLTPNEAQTDQLLQAIQKFAAQDFKNSVRVVVTADIALAGLQTLDGIALAAGDRVLVAGQTAALQNGIYVVAAGAWTRSVDSDTSIEVTDGLLVAVEQGTTNADTVWQLVTNSPIVLGTTALTFEKAAGLSGVTAGTYKSLTVDKRGRVVGGTNPTTLAGYGITDAQQPGEVSFFATNTAPAGYLKANGAAISRTSYAALFAALVTAAGFTAKSFTVTIASPGVFTYAGHGFSNGARVRLTTTGALPTGLTAGVDYFVEVIDANTFYLATTLLGARIVTSGSQSGTHSYLQSWFGLGDGSTTFNLPDLRGEFLRGWDDGRSVDAGRVFGSAQMDAMQNIVGTFSQGGSAGGTGPFSTTGSYGGVGQNAQVNYTSTFDASRVVRTSTEERPRNVAVLACIKY